MSRPLRLGLVAIVAATALAGGAAYWLGYRLPTAGANRPAEAIGVIHVGGATIRSVRLYPEQVRAIERLVSAGLPVSEARRSDLDRVFGGAARFLEVITATGEVVVATETRSPLRPSACTLDAGTRPLYSVTLASTTRAIVLKTPEWFGTLDGAFVMTARPETWASLRDRAGAEPVGCR